MNEIERILAYHRNDFANVADTAEKKKRVLVVEGDGFTRITLMNFLLAAGFEVDFAPNGRLGLHQLRMWKPDTLIMEINLRDLSGLDLIKRARQEASFKDRPIYVFTSVHFLKRATRKELSVAGVNLFDKLSIAPETLVVNVATELLGGKRDSEQSETAQLAAKLPDGLSETMGEIWLQAKTLARCSDPKKRIAACAELREKVYALLSHAAVGGYRKTARQAKALVDFLDHLCEQSEHVSDAALNTVARSVEVLSGLAHEKVEEPEEAAKFKVVVVGETSASCDSIQETFQGAGIEPVSFADPAKALEHLSTEPADLIITNLSAAGQEAFDLAKVRALQLHQETPVIEAPQAAPESGDGSLPAQAHEAELESAGHTELLMQALNVLQKPAADDALAASVSAEPGVPTHEVPGTSLPESDRLHSVDDSLQGRLIRPPSSKLEVPQEEVSASHQPEAPTQASGASKPKQKAKKGTVLFVEDDPVLLKVYKRALKAEGFRVEVVEDGLAAIESLPKVRPDVVILDLMLPKMHGLEVLKFIRADMNLKATPVVILSNAFMEGLAAKALQEGANKGLLKSQCTPAKLVEVVSGLARKPGETASSTDMGQFDSETSFVAYGENGETSIWTRKDKSRRDAPVEIAKIRQACVAYVKSVGSAESMERLAVLYRRLRFFGARSGLCGFTKLAEVAGAFEALLFEVIYKKVEPNASILQTMAQTVDCLGNLVEKGDTAFPEPIRRPRVLVVDDDAVCTLTTVAALKLAKVDAVGTQDPKESLRILESGDFDVVMLDVEMPGLDGYQVCEQLRRMPQYKSTPVMFFTVNGDVTRRARGVLVGGNDFAMKPITSTELILKLTLQWVKSAPRAEAAAQEQPSSPFMLIPTGPGLTSNRGNALGSESARGEESTMDEPAVGESEVTLIGGHQIPGGETDKAPVDTDYAGAAATEENELPIDPARDQGVLGEQIVGAEDSVANCTEGVEDTQAPTMLGQPQPVQEQDLLAKYEKERQMLVTRVYNSENELHQERARLKRREKTIENLQKKLEDLQAKTGQVAADGTGENRLEVSAAATEALPDTSTLAKNAQEAETRCRQLEGELAELRKSREELEERSREQGTRRSELEELSKELEVRLNERSGELDRAKAELQKQVNDRAQNETDLREQLQAVEAAQKEAQLRCSKLESELDELRQAREELEERSKELEKRGGESERRSSELEERLGKTSQELEHAKVELEKRNKEHSNTEAELWKELEAAVGAQKQSEERCCELEKEIAGLRQAREELEKGSREQGVRSKELEERSEELEKRLVTASKELEHAKAEMERQSEEHASAELELRQQLDLLAGEQKKSQARFGQLEAELRQQLEATGLGQQQAQERYSQLESELAELQKARQELEQRSREQEARSRELEEQGGESERRSKALEEQLKDRSAQLERAMAELEKRREEYSSTEAELWKELDATVGAQKQSQERCLELEKEIAELRQVREELDARVQREAQAAQESARRAAELDQRGKDLEKHLQERSAELESARAELSKQGKDRSEAEKELRQQLDLLTAEQMKSQGRCGQLEVELGSLRQAREELEKRSKDLEESLKVRSVELDGARADLENQGKIHAQAEAELRQQLEAIGLGQQQAQERYSQLVKELSELRQAREELEKGSQQQGARSRELEERSEELEKRLGMASQELERARMELEKQVKAHTKVETSLRQELEKVGAEQKQAHQRCSQLEGELAALREAREELNVKVAGEAERAGESERRSKELQRQLEDTSAELERARVELEKRNKEQLQAEGELWQELETLSAAHKQAQVRCSQLEGELSTLCRVREELEKGSEAQGARSRELEERSKELEKSLDGKFAELALAKAELEKQGKTHTQVETELRQQLSTADQGGKQLQTRCSQLEKELSELRQARQELEKGSREQGARSRELEERSKELEKSLDGKSAELVLAKAELEKQGKAHAQVETELRRELEMVGAEQKQAHQRCSQLEGELVALRQTREELSVKAAGEEARAGESERRSKELEKRLEDTSAELEQARAEMEKQSRESSHVEAKLRQQLDTASSGQSQAQEHCSQLEAELANMRQLREELILKLSQEKERVGESEKRSKELEKRLEDKTAELERARAERERQNEEHANAELQLRQQLETATAGQKEARDLCGQLDRELAILQQVREDLKSELCGEKERSGESERRSKELEKRLEDTSVELAAAKAEIEKQGQEHSNAEADLRQQLEVSGAGQKLAQAQCTQLEGELASLRHVREELEERSREQEARSRELEVRGRELEERFKECSAELAGTREALEKEGKKHSKAEAEFWQQLQTADADQKKVQARCSQLEGELASLRQVREDLDSKLGHEQKVSAELGRRGLELEKRLEQAETTHQVAVTDMEDRIRRGVNALTRVTSDLENERVDRARAEEQNVVLAQRLQELHEELGRHLQNSRESQQRIVSLEQQVRQNEEKHARILADLEQERAQAQLAEEQLQRANELNERYQKNITSLSQANMVLLSSREDLQNMLESNLGILHKTEARLEQKTAELQRLSEEFEAGQRSLQVQRQTMERQESQIAELVESSKDIAGKLQAETAARQRLREESEAAQRRLRAHEQTIERQSSQIKETLELSSDLEVRLRAETGESQRLREELEAARRSLRSQTHAIERQGAEIKETRELTQELGARLQTEVDERQRLNGELEAAQRNNQEQRQIINRQELQIKEGLETSAILENRVQKEGADRQELLQELQAARRTATIESEKRQIESSKYQAEVQKEQVERRRLETNLVRLRHATIKAARAGRMVRQKLRRQTGEPVGALLESVRRLLAGEINAERKAVAEGMLEQLLLLKAGIQEPRPGAGGVNGERRVGADLNPERREQIKE